MKYIMCSRTFPAGHPKKGQPTGFVEKIWACQGITITQTGWELPEMKAFSPLKTLGHPKHHTIRSGSRYKPGDMVSLRVWSGLPYRSKQIEFAQVEVKKTWDVEIYATEYIFELKVNGIRQTKEGQELVALNDGLNLIDFYNWFNIHPKKKGEVFRGQVICWSDAINY